MSLDRIVFKIELFVVGKSGEVFDREAEKF